MDKKLKVFYNLAELLVLLILPLPFLKLNLIYVFAAIILMILGKYLRKESWSSYGFIPLHHRPIVIAVIIGICFGYADNYLIEPLLKQLTGYSPDLSTYENIRGKFAEFITLLVIGWVVGGFFEEFFFRGYLFHRFSTLIQNTFWFRVISIILTSVVFALAHNYQGIGGIIVTFYFSVIMGILYFYFKRNVWYLFFIHGLYDTVGIIRLYLGQ